jgi:hypothetical protein
MPWIARVMEGESLAGSRGVRAGAGNVGSRPFGAAMELAYRVDTRARAMTAAPDVDSAADA